MRKSGGKASKFVPLSPEDIAKDKILLPGRHECTCEASRHGLINNCQNCGRIVCEQEGSGPCFTCQELVCTPKEMAIICKESKSSYKLYNKLMGDAAAASGTSATSDQKLQSALEQRDKLLEFDKTSERRTKVIDDEMDYFQLNSRWLSEEERKIRAKKHEEMQDQMHNRRSTNITFDFAGRKVVEERAPLKIDEDFLLKPDTSIFQSPNVPLDIPADFQPVFQDSARKSDASYLLDNAENAKKLLNARHNIRLQDSELQIMSDEGNCLSVHQPWASLLISGIKKYEGRAFYTSHRGRLWIHAAGAVPKPQEIAKYEKAYRHILGNVTFPKTYPTGCLLGCLDLVDCLPGEIFHEKYPEGECDAAYVFICENAQEMSLKFPMKGGMKIFKLDSNIHQAAKKSLSNLAL